MNEAWVMWALSVGIAATAISGLSIWAWSRGYHAGRKDAGPDRPERVRDGGPTPSTDGFDPGTEQVRHELRTYTGEVLAVTRGQSEDAHKKLDEVLHRLERLHTQTTSGRPTRLTEIGEQIATSIGNLDSWAATLTDRLRNRWQKAEAWKIDDICRKYTRTQLDPAARRQVTKTAYEFGIEENSVEDVLQVVLREHMLKEREKSESRPTDEYHENERHA